MDPLSEFNKNVFNYILPRSLSAFTTLIKKHDCKLSNIGDFSFPLNLEAWKKSIGEEDFEVVESGLLNLLENNPDQREEKLMKHVEESKSWRTPLKSARLWNDRCSLFLDRMSAIKILMELVLCSDDYGKCKNSNKQKFYISSVYSKDIVTSVSEYRALLVSNTIRNMLLYVGHDVCTAPTSDTVVLTILSNAAPTKVDVDCESTVVKCGIVTDPADNKISRITNEEYASLRSTDMQLMAMHKYGIRVQNEECFRKLITHLGTAAVTIDLLEVKHTSPVSIKRNNQGCSKGASFILYNSARIETLLRTFNEKVEKGVYEALPQLSDIDMLLLKEEEEWQLLFNFVLTFPNLINRTLDGIEKGKCSPHLLVKFLGDMVGLFSIYYRRVKILMDNRKHLMPVIHARIYLVQCIQRILNRILSFLDIEPASYM